MTPAPATPSRHDGTGISAQVSLPVHQRRLLFGLLVAATVVATTALMIATLSRGGFDWLDLVLTACFAVTLPWTVVGFWNALIGLLLMRLSTDPARLVCPVALDVDSDDAIASHTALLMCVRNEAPHQVARKLDITIEGLVNTGTADKFHAYVLSDSTSDEAVKTEQLVFGRLEDRWRGILPVTYRRRTNNAGFKAGNIRDFCDRWGHQHDYAVVLDADSLMSASSILRLVRTMQRNPRLGILQSLVVGMPTLSPFARIFQFGMRLGMRSYTLGSAWWQGDCGPYWGHNALIRLAPFIQHCHLPTIPGRPPLGGSVLSHDQVEAALMRSAGYDVRVLPDEDGSWEENPPTLLEHLRRDLRWCHGNMQYWRLLGMPGLAPVSRIQLVLAILMYLGSPAWIAFMTILALRAGLTDNPSDLFHAQTGGLLFACVMTMVFAPKLATLADVLATPKARRAFGGSVSVVLSALLEILFSAILAPVIALAHSMFLLGLPFGRAAVWSAQRRDTHAVTTGEAAVRLWPQTLFGVVFVIWLYFTTPAALVGYLPFLLGSLLAVPIAVLTSWERIGSFLAFPVGVWRIPDEVAPAFELRSLQLPALQQDRKMLATSRAALNTAPSD